MKRWLLWLALALLIAGVRVEGIPQAARSRCDGGWSHVTQIDVSGTALK